MTEREWEPGMVPVDDEELVNLLYEHLTNQAPRADGIEVLYGAEWRLAGIEVRFGERSFVISVKQATTGDTA